MASSSFCPSRLQAMCFAASLCEPLGSGMLCNTDHRLALFTMPLPAEDDIVDSVKVEVLPFGTAAATDDLYEVATIFNHRLGRHGTMEFLTAYVGYEYNPSWQPLCDFKTGRRISNLQLLAYVKENRLVL